MKQIKRVISIILAVSMLSALFAAPSSVFAVDNQTPREPENYTYDEMIAYFQQHMKQRETEISCSFDSYDLSYYNMAGNSSSVNYPRTGNELYDKIVLDVFTKCYSTAPDPQLGDYLFNSIRSINPLEGMRSVYQDMAGTPFVTIDVTFSFSYYSTYEQEEAVSRFLSLFSRKYLNTNMTDYQKVKTIYDFVVRNTTYDHDVFEGTLYSPDSERYLISHSAYGAVYGNLIKDGKSDADYNDAYKTTLTGEKVINLTDQGLAVCEGYSKLFYALCVKNGIDCRIVDGDYVEQSQKPSDPHEWNYVWLDDGVKEDGARWYQIDTTFASQGSMKEIDMQSYSFFLRGYNSSHFGYNHQMPYENYGFGDNEKDQLYNWYTEENICSDDDYAFPSAQFSVQEEAEKGFILRRVTRYEGEDEDKVSYIYTDLDQSFFVAVDEDGNILLEEIEGFGFTGIESHFDVVLPYLVAGEEYLVQGARATAAGSDYYITVATKDNAESLRIPFEIVPRDMSNNSGNYSENDIQTDESYSGNIVQPRIEIKDGYGNELYSGYDYDVYYYTDAARTIPATLKDIGDYFGDIVFKGNYSGHYYFNFTIGKADLSRVEHPDISFPYLPAYLRNKNGLSTPADFYLHGAGNINIGGLTLVNGEDYSVSYTTNAPSSASSLDWGADGTISLTGLATSNKIQGGTVTTFNYSINQKYDISDFDGKYIDNKVYHYTGNAIYPSTHDGVSSYLEEGKDYRVVSYSDNVNAGNAKVTIDGINGCEGRITMYYYIAPLSIADGTISDVNINNGAITYNFLYGNKKLTKNVDYTDKVEPTATGYKLTITGKGNYTSSYIVNITVKSGGSSSGDSSGGASSGGSSSGGSGSGSSSAPLNIYVPKTKVTKVKAKKKSATVTWSPVKGYVTGYRIEYSLAKNFAPKKTKYVYVKGAGKKSCTIKKLKSKKKYYIRVRTYYSKGNYTYLAPVSNVKAVKAK